MISVHKSIKTYLLSVPEITAITSTRIYGGRSVPPKRYHPNLGGCIVFNRRGGQSLVRNSHLNPSMQFKCYGLTEVAAEALGCALFDAFDVAGNQYFKSVQVEVQGQLIEEQTDWVFDLWFYRFIMKSR